MCMHVCERVCECMHICVCMCVSVCVAGLLHSVISLKTCGNLRLTPPSPFAFFLPGLSQSVWLISPSWPPTAITALSWETGASDMWIWAPGRGEPKAHAGSRHPGEGRKGRQGLRFDGLHLNLHQAAAEAKSWWILVSMNRNKGSSFQATFSSWNPASVRGLNTGSGLWVAPSMWTGMEFEDRCCVF